MGFTVVKMITTDIVTLCFSVAIYRLEGCSSMPSNLQLPLPRVTTKTLAQFAQCNDMISFIKEYRRINPGLSIEEAKADFAHFRKVLENRG